MARAHRFVSLCLALAAACSGEESGPDAGTPAADAGQQQPADAGTTDTDAGTTGTDAGTTDIDAGTTDTDAGPTDTDAGPTDTDAGSQQPDAGTPPADFPATKYTTWNKSGSRLTARAVVDAVGNSTIAWFEDTQQANQKCLPQKASDGVLRCLPFGGDGAELQTNSGPGGFFTTNTCTTALLGVADACATRTVQAQRADATRVYRIGTEHTGSVFTQVLDRNNNPMCIAGQRPAGRKLFTYTEVPAADFVAFTESSLQVEGRIGLRILTGADGSSVVSGLYDSVSNKPAVLYASNRLAAVYQTVRFEDLVRISCGGPRTGVVGPTYGTYNPDYIEVMLSMQMPGGPGMPGGGPIQTIPQLRKVVSAQNFHCGTGTQVNVGAGQAVYVIEETATEPTTLPLVDRRSDTRTSVVHFGHLVTESGRPIAPNGAGPGFGGLVIPGARTGPMLRGGQVVVGTRDFVSTELYSNATCTAPTVPVGGGGTTGDVILLSRPLACESLPGLELDVTGVWSVGAQIPMQRQTYFFDGQSCQENGPAQILSTTDAATQAGTYFAPVPMTSL